MTGSELDPVQVQIYRRETVVVWLRFAFRNYSPPVDVQRLVEERVGDLARLNQLLAQLHPLDAQAVVRYFQLEHGDPHNRSQADAARALGVVVNRLRKRLNGASRTVIEILNP